MIMPPTEAGILSDFLIAPAPLPSIISLQKFTDLFPRPQRSNPQIKDLYGELKGKRTLDIEHVKRNIAQEVRRGEKLRRQVIKTRWRGAHEEKDPIHGRAKGAQAAVRVSRSNSQDRG